MRRFLLIICLLSTLSIPCSFAQSECWSWMIGNTGFEKIDVMTVDKSGNIWIAGTYDGTVDFDPDTSTNELTSTGFSEAFVASYRSDGSYRFAYAIPGFLQIEAMDVDTSGNVYMTGYHLGIVDVDPGPGVENLPVFGSTDLCVMSYDTDGNLRWAEGYGSVGNEEGTSIKIDAAQNVLLGGYISESVVFESDTVTSTGGTDAFVAKFTNTGSLSWVKAYGGTDFDEGTVLVASDDANNTDQAYYMSFAYLGSVDILTNAGLINLNSLGERDVLIANMDTSGNVQHAWSIGGSGDDFPAVGAMDTSDHLFLSGIFNDTLDIDPDPNGTFTLASEGENDLFVIKHTPTGLLNTGMSIGGPLYDSPTDMSFSRFTDGSYGLFVGAEFDTLTKIPSNATPPTQLNTNGFFDSYLAVFDPATLELLCVDQYGGEEGDVGLKFKTVFVNDGSDTPKVQIIITGRSSGSIDLNSSYSSGCDTPQVHTSTGGFDFFVASNPVSKANPISSISSTELLPLRLYPNPVHDFLLLEGAEERLRDSQLEVKIYDMQGRMLLDRTTVLRSSVEIPVYFLSTGLYILQVSAKDGRHFVRKFLRD